MNHHDWGGLYKGVWRLGTHRGKGLGWAYARDSYALSNESGLEEATPVECFEPNLTAMAQSIVKNILVGGI